MWTHASTHEHIMHMWTHARIITGPNGDVQHLLTKRNVVMSCQCLNFKTWEDSWWLAADMWWYWLCMCACMSSRVHEFTCVHVCLHVFMCACMYAHVPVCMYVFAWECVLACVHVYMCACMCLYASLYQVQCRNPTLPVPFNKSLDLPQWSQTTTSCLAYITADSQLLSTQRLCDLLPQ